MSFICCVDPAHLQKFAINLLANFLGGYLVLEAGDGLEALAQLETNPHIKLILLDIHMPNMNGLECLELLHARGVVTPVIILTAEADPEIIRRAKALGARAWLKKPLKVELLGAMVAKAIAPGDLPT